MSSCNPEVMSVHVLLPESLVSASNPDVMSLSVSPIFLLDEFVSGGHWATSYHPVPEPGLYLIKINDRCVGLLNGYICSLVIVH